MDIEPNRLLGIEGGGTRTVALLTNGKSRLFERIEAGPANLRLLSDAALRETFRRLARGLPRPAAIGIGLAGARTSEDRARIERAAAIVWPGIPCLASNDLETAWFAGEIGARAAVTRIVVLSGTGSCCYGQTPEGESAKVGGWGHFLGDKGSAYEIGLRALKAAVYYYDRDGKWPSLGERLLRALQLNEPDDLVQWIQTAPKDDVARLAMEVFDAWAFRDKIADDILQAAAATLAKDAAACARRLGSKSPVEFLLTGSVLSKQPRFARMAARQIKSLSPQARIRVLKIESAWGAVELARRAFDSKKAASNTGRRRITHVPLARTFKLPETLQLSPTEQRNPRSTRLDQMPLGQAIALMLSEEARVPHGILAERKKIQRAIGWIVKSFRHGGRLFYVGAGTSGRLGVLDASECPPTFRVPAERVQGIIAGGQRALWSSVEGAEDDLDAGVRAVQFRGITHRDVLIGIAASGRTPFVWGGLSEAKRRGARTVLLCFNPHLKIPREIRPGLVIAPEIGPEVLTGSTRLKSGTATKLILNLFTTLSMVRIGKVVSNLMVDVHPSNTKLRARAVRILETLTGAGTERCRIALEQSGWVIKEAWKKFRRSKHY